MKILLKTLVSSWLALSFVTAVHADFPSYAAEVERVVQTLVAPPAFLLGAAAHINVGGEWNNDLMEQVKEPGPIGQ